MNVFESMLMGLILAMLSFLIFRGALLLEVIAGTTSRVPCYVVCPYDPVHYMSSSNQFQRFDLKVGQQNDSPSNVTYDFDCCFMSEQIGMSHQIQ